MHGYSTLARFPDGACVVEKEDDWSSGPQLLDRLAARSSIVIPTSGLAQNVLLIGLLEACERISYARFRRLLEDCDTAQGFHLVIDSDSGFGGMGAALLTRIRDVSPMMVSSAHDVEDIFFQRQANVSSLSGRALTKLYPVAGLLSCPVSRSWSWYVHSASEYGLKPARERP